MGCRYDCDEPSEEEILMRLADQLLTVLDHSRGSVLNKNFLLTEYAKAFPNQVKRKVSLVKYILYSWEKCCRVEYKVLIDFGRGIHQEKLKRRKIPVAWLKGAIFGPSKSRSGTISRSV